MIDTQAFNLLFDEARTPRGWHEDKPVDAELITQIWDKARLGPTSANCSPLRMRIFQSAAGKEKLKEVLMEANIPQTMAAPVTVMFGYDLTFYINMDKLYPHTNARAWFEGNEPLIQETAFRNATLQAAYFMMAARAHGLDCGPMSGFDADKATQLFFAGTTIRANFLCNLGYGKKDDLKPRDWRYDFSDVAQVL